LELEHEETARQEADKVAKEQEKRKLELLKHEQDQQDKLRQGYLAVSFTYIQLMI